MRFAPALLTPLWLALLACGDGRSSEPARITEPQAADLNNVPAHALDDALRSQLLAHGVTGRTDASLAQRLGRPGDAELAEIGALVTPDQVAGDRYYAAGMAMSNR